MGRARMGEFGGEGGPDHGWLHVPRGGDGGLDRGRVRPAPVSVPPNALVALTLDVVSADPSWFDAGLNVHADAGMLVAGSNTLLLNGQITHPGSQQLTSGVIAFDFAWEAPGFDRSVTFSTVANAVDGGAPLLATAPPSRPIW